MEKKKNSQLIDLLEKIPNKLIKTKIRITDILKYIFFIIIVSYGLKYFKKYIPIFKVNDYKYKNIILS